MTLCFCQSCSDGTGESESRLTRNTPPKPSLNGALLTAIDFQEIKIPTLAKSGLGWGTEQRSAIAGKRFERGRLQPSRNRHKRILGGMIRERITPPKSRARISVRLKAHPFKTPQAALRVNIADADAEMVPHFRAWAMLIT